MTLCLAYIAITKVNVIPILFTFKFQISCFIYLFTRAT